MRGQATTNTRHKLNEASFFLSKLDEHYHDNVRNLITGERQPPVFSYFLSAFVSAARSVTWIMRSEYAKIAGWEQWYQSKQVIDEERALLKLFNDLRVRSEKSEPLLPGYLLRFANEPGAPERDLRVPRIRVSIRSADEGDDRIIQDGEVVAWTWTLDELDGQDVLAACRGYRALLSALMDECEARFAHPAV